MLAADIGSAFIRDVSATRVEAPKLTCRELHAHARGAEKLDRVIERGVIRIGGVDGNAWNCAGCHFQRPSMRRRIRGKGDDGPIGIGRRRKHLLGRRAGGNGPCEHHILEHAGCAGRVGREPGNEQSSDQEVSQISEHETPHRPIPIISTPGLDRTMTFSRSG
jgi:hypothetical protein